MDRGSPGGRRVLGRTEGPRVDGGSLGRPRVPGRTEGPGEDGGSLAGAAVTMPEAVGGLLHGAVAGLQLGESSPHRGKTGLCWSSDSGCVW